mgnify:CR=1 FL=1
MVRSALALGQAEQRRGGGERFGGPGQRQGGAGAAALETKAPTSAPAASSDHAGAKRRLSVRQLREDLDAAGVDPTLRAEDLDLPQWAAIAAGVAR